MKKSKFLKTLAAIAVGAVAVVGAFSFAACGGGEEADTGNGTENSGTENTENNPSNKPENNPGTTPSTPTVHNYTYSYTALTTAMGINDDGKQTTTDKVEVTQANLTTPNDFLKLGSGTVTWRCLKKANGGAIEVKDEGLTVTFRGTGTITIGFGSTSDSNTSGIALINSAGTYLVAESTTGTLLAADQTIADGYVNKTNLCTKVGGQKTAEAATVTYKITEAGTYTIYSSFSYIDAKDGKAKSRGCRIWSISMSDTY
ncbi:MAG: hypothetical protein K2O28_00730 [Clostridia bacterium]|nr:hypothetical protein [Clostridia bacterium]